MPTTVTVHSYRGGTGKSTIAATLALLAAARGNRTALVDADLQTPSAHALFGIAAPTAHRSLADYLIGRCEIEEAAGPISGDEHPAEHPTRHADDHGDEDVDDHGEERADGRGALFVVLAHCGPDEINEIMTCGYDVGLLREGFARLIDRLALDVLVVDTRAGVSNETMSAIAGSDVVLIVTRADHLDARAGQAVALASRFARARQAVVVNMLPEGLPAGLVRGQAEAVFGSPVVAVIPYCADIAAFGSRGLFVRAHPDHRTVADFRQIADAVLNRKDQ